MRGLLLAHAERLETLHRFAGNGPQLQYILVNIGKGDQFKENFLKISPNNRISAIIDHNLSAGRPISVFETGAILIYLGNKTGLFYLQDLRGRTEVHEWQMGGLGSMIGHAGHFKLHGPEKLQYAIVRYNAEILRHYGVLDKRLENRWCICDECSPIGRGSSPTNGRRSICRANSRTFTAVTSCVKAARRSAGSTRSASRTRAGTTKPVRK